MKINEEKSLIELINKYVENNNRKNDVASKYWYPLNYATYGTDEILSAINSLINFQTSMGKKTKLFEQNFSNFLNTKGSVFCNSGSSADLLAINSVLKSPKTRLEIGDMVLVPAITWPTQVWSIMQCGLVPILFDCSKETFNPDILSVPDEILKKCKAIFTTHILGCCSDIDTLINICEKYNIELLEDSCESLGAKYKGAYLGTFGSVATFSTFFSHHMTTLEGGIVTSNCEDILVQTKISRAHGWSRGIHQEELDIFLEERNINLSQFDNIDNRYLFLDQGYNFRPTEINASFGIHQLEKLHDFNVKRKYLSSYFYDSILNLKHLKGPEIVSGCEPCFMALPLKIYDSNKSFQFAIDYLESEGIESRPLIAGNLIKHPAGERYNLKAANDKLEGADYHHSKSFYVGLTPYHTKDDVEKLIKTIEKLDLQI
tara:strand:+ start:25382 stop:26674 length:1293 start_codon:yes stop_codon:yes gene_type:complete